MNNHSPDPRQRLVDAARDAEARGLNRGTAGNLSVRHGRGMLITPTGMPVPMLGPDEMVEMDFDGRWQGSLRPSSEWAMHAAIYRAFPDASAIVHAHPDYCVALSCLREPLPPFHYMIASFGGDDVRCAAYEPFGTAALGEAAVVAMSNRNSCLLANHGMITYGPDIATTVARAEKLETLVRQYMIACAKGPPALLTADELTVVKEGYKVYGQRKDL